MSGDLTDRARNVGKLHLSSWHLILILSQAEKCQRCVSRLQYSLIVPSPVSRCISWALASPAWSDGKSGENNINYDGNYCPVSGSPGLWWPLEKSIGTILFVLPLYVKFNVLCMFYTWKEQIVYCSLNGRLCPLYMCTNMSFMLKDIKRTAVLLSRFFPSPKIDHFKFLWLFWFKCRDLYGDIFIPNSSTAGI